MSEDQRVTFYEFFPPPLESGDYLVSVKHRVSGGAGDQAFDETFHGSAAFAVQGVRFSIPPQYLQSHYPPMGAQGEYGNVLPHVVFTARTLPWQRSLGIPGGDGLEHPWLAVLVFDEADPAPAPVDGTLQDLLSPPGGIASYPGLALEYGQSRTDPVRYLDVPAALFAAVAPRSAELAWLAGARGVSKQALAARALALDGADTPTGEAAVVVGNRLAREGARTTAALVSLEGMGAYLPDREGPPAGTAAVRLAVLDAWSFSSVAVPVTFSEYLEGVDASPPTLQVPYDGERMPGGAYLRDALAMGYVALAHHTRQGAELVSWYRGPFLPFAARGTVHVPVGSQDELTAYDPETGMLDLSLAAAWQLGRLLALNDAAFAAALYVWKRGQTVARVNAFEQRLAAEALGLEAGPRVHPADFHRRLMREAVAPALAAFLAGRDGRPA